MHHLHRCKHLQLHISHLSALVPIMRWMFIVKWVVRDIYFHRQVKRSMLIEKCWRTLERFRWITPKSVTKIRAPLQPRGCPKDTAPPCTFTLSCTWRSERNLEQWWDNNYKEERNWIERYGIAHIEWLAKCKSYSNYSIHVRSIPVANIKRHNYTNKKMCGISTNMGENTHRRDSK